jgi:tetratricopeptide (TPR) repeat protein
MADSDRPARRRRVPLAPLWRRTDYEILRDVEESLSLVLWHAVRQVREWVESSPAERAARQREATAEVKERHSFASVQAPELSAALGTFAVLNRAPRLIDAAQLVAACSAVAEWAAGHSMGATAMQFAEAAAAVDPQSARLANRAGRVCRQAGEFERALVWYERAAALATVRVHPSDRAHTDEYIRAHLGIAGVYYALGTHPEAAPHLARAEKRARSRNRRGPAGEASHDLMALADAIGTFSEVVHHGRAALENYPPRHPRVPVFALDFSYALTRNGHGALAVQVLDRIGPLIESPSLQVLYWGNVARARASVGDSEGFRTAAQRVAETAMVYDQFAGAACINVAEGARLLEEWDMGERYAATALDVARERRDGMVARLAAELLDRIAVREKPQLPGEQAGEELTRFVGELVRRLDQWRRGRAQARRTPPEGPAPG